MININSSLFNDFDQYIESLQQWDLELNQLDKGKFRGELFQIFTKDVFIHHNKFSRKFKINGCAPKGYLNFGLVVNTRDEGVWKGQLAHENSLLIYPNDGEIEAVSPSNFYSIELSISKDLLIKYIDVYQIKSINSLLKENSVLDCDNDLRNECIGYLIENLNQLKKKGSPRNSKLFVNEISSAVPQYLLKLLSNYKSISTKLYTDKRSNAIININMILEEQLEQNYSVPQLCLMCGVSIRTLEYTIKSQYDLTPIQYIKKIKLNKVRNVFLKTNSKEIKIIDIANKYGFWHMGQFAKDYKNLFGELPSETINRKLFY